MSNQNRQGGGRNTLAALTNTTPAGEANTFTNAPASSLVDTTPVLSGDGVAPAANSGATGGLPTPNADGEFVVTSAAANTPGADAGTPNATQKDALETVKAKERDKAAVGAGNRFDTTDTTGGAQRPVVAKAQGKKTDRGASAQPTTTVVAKTRAEALAREHDGGELGGNVTKPARPLDQITQATARAKQISPSGDPTVIRQIRDEILLAEQREPNTKDSRVGRMMRERRQEDRRDAMHARDPHSSDPLASVRR